MTLLRTRSLSFPGRLEGCGLWEPYFFPQDESKRKDRNRSHEKKQLLGHETAWVLTPSDGCSRSGPRTSQMNGFSASRSGQAIALPARRYAIKRRGEGALNTQIVGEWNPTVGQVATPVLFASKVLIMCIYKSTELLFPSSFSFTVSQF